MRRFQARSGWSASGENQRGRLTWKHDERQRLGADPIAGVPLARATSRCEGQRPSSDIRVGRKACEALRMGALSHWTVPIPNPPGPYAVV